MVSHLAYISNSSSNFRIYPETTPVIHDDFELDKTRIIYSSSFRKLQYKTQVFLNNAGDYHRTRLTHTLEVAQLSRVLCASLGLNSLFAEAVALAHDLGHTPFGHSGEDALNEVIESWGLNATTKLGSKKTHKFCHNSQSLRIIDRLEKRYGQFDGLNLSSAVIEGLVKHNGPLNIDQQNHSFIHEIISKYGINPCIFPPLEAQIASIADDIAYTNHDIEDGWRSGLLGLDDITELPLVGEFIQATIKSCSTQISKSEEKILLYEALNKSIETMILDIRDNIVETVERLRLRNLDDVANSGVLIANFSVAVAEKRKVIREYLWKNLYKNPQMLLGRFKVHNIVKELFSFFMEKPGYLPYEWQSKIEKSTEPLQIHICDFIAGMTDRYAIAKHQKIFGNNFD